MSCGFCSGGRRLGVRGDGAVGQQRPVVGRVSGRSMLRLGGDDAPAARREPFPPVRRRAGVVARAHFGADGALAGAIGFTLLLRLLASLPDLLAATALEVVIATRAQRRVPRGIT